MKKFLSMIAAVSLLAASLSACGASSTTSTTAAAESGKEYKVERAYTDAREFYTLECSEFKEASA